MSSKASKSSEGSAVKQPPASVIDFQHLFQKLPQPYLLFAANDPEFTIIDLNEARERAMGVKREEALGRPLFEVYPDTNNRYRRSSSSEILAKIRDTIKLKQIQYLAQVRFDMRDGNGSFYERYWQSMYQPVLDDNGEVTYVLAATRDVTEEVLTERQLEETEARLKAATAIGRVGSWMWEAKTGKVIANATFARMIGIDPTKSLAGIAPETLINAVHPDDRTRVTADIRKGIVRHTAVETEFRVLDNEGIVKWILMRAKANFAKDGAIESFPGVTVDITERHDLEAQIEAARLQEETNRQEATILQKRNKELEEVSRTKDEFVALASHQLRTPATAVKQYIGMVLQGYAGDISSLQTDMLEKAFESNERQIQIINQILNAARVDTGRLVVTLMPVDLQRLVTNICEEMRPSIEQHGHTLAVNLGSEPVMVSGDSGYLRMAIENIIQNANVYTPEGDGTITVAMRRLASSIKLTITDTGVGIRKTDIPKLFIKFSRIPNPLSVQAGGTGIGLYLTAEILRLHGGKVGVQSKVGVGTTFTVTLPLRRGGKTR